MSDIRVILSDIKKRKFAPVYILTGEEPYYIDVLVAALEKTVVLPEDKEFDQSVIYGADANVQMILESAGQYPMMSEKRLVLVKELQAMHQAKVQLNKLKSYIDSPNAMTVMCLVYKGETLPETSPLLKAAKKNKDVVVFKSPKIRENKLGEIIRDYCFGEKIKIEEKAIDLLVTKVGASLTNIFSDIEKLRVVAKDDNEKITADMVSENIGISKEFNNFELKNALARRDFYQTLLIIKHFEENSRANPLPPLTSLIFNFYQQLLIAAFNPDKSESALIKVLQVKTPYLPQDIRIGLAHYNAAQLVTAIHAIRDFDVRSKGIGSFQKEFPLFRELMCRLLTI